MKIVKEVGNRSREYGKNIRCAFHDMKTGKERLSKLKQFFESPFYMIASPEIKASLILDLYISSFDFGTKKQGEGIFSSSDKITDFEAVELISSLKKEIENIIFDSTDYFDLLIAGALLYKLNNIQNEHVDDLHNDILTIFENKGEVGNVRMLFIALQCFNNNQDLAFWGQKLNGFQFNLETWETFLAIPDVSKSREVSMSYKEVLIEGFLTLSGDSEVKSVQQKVLKMLDSLLKNTKDSSFKGRIEHIFGNVNQIDENILDELKNFDFPG